MDLEFRDATRKPPSHPVGVERANKGSTNEAREDRDLEEGTREPRVEREEETKKDAIKRVAKRDGDY